MEDQRKEPKQQQQQGVEPADYGKEESEAEAAKPEEQTDQRKAEPAVEEKEKETERSSDQEESMQDSSPLVHPCSQLLQFVARACARCLGMSDSLDDDGGASLNSSGEVRVLTVNKASGSTGFYMQEMFTAVLVQLRRLQPGRNDPRPGKGGVVH